MRSGDRSSVKGVIDRFEGDIAVFISEDGESKLEIHRPLLPEDAAEGSVVEIKIKTKKNKEREAKEKVGKLIEKLKMKNAK